MLRIILIYGLIGAVIVGGRCCGHADPRSQRADPENGELVGYAIMLVALTAVFLGVKHYRDKEKGGVIRFLPALGVGLGISAVCKPRLGDRVGSQPCRDQVRLRRRVFWRHDQKAQVEGATEKVAQLQADQVGLRRCMPTRDADGHHLHGGVPGRCRDRVDLGGVAAQQPVSAGAGELATGRHGRPISLIWPDGHTSGRDGPGEADVSTEKDARFWNRAARKYAASPIGDMDGFERTLAAVRAYISGKHVLEFGAGTGTAALKLARTPRGMWRRISLPT